VTALDRVTQIVGQMRGVVMNLLQTAREAGMVVLLDACIGRERFHSVAGSEAALKQFALLCNSALPGADTLARWARLCEEGHSGEVAMSIRTVLGECNATFETTGR
jgi:hypothetical protein